MNINIKEATEIIIDISGPVAKKNLMSAKCARIRDLVAEYRGREQTTEFDDGFVITATFADKEQAEGFRMVYKNV